MGDLATDSGKIIKMEIDYSSECDEKIPACKKLAAEGKMHDALDCLLALEKQTRLGADTISTGRVLVAIVQVCRDADNWTALNEHINLLAKRRSQLKQAVAKMVGECCVYVEQAPDRDTMLRLIDTLRAVTEGKIYVEVERARLTHRLARLREEEGDTEQAANIIQELQVETYGSMDKREKVELILEQMRLCLAKRDYIRTQIISKKINTKFFEDESSQDLKIKYYRLMMELDGQGGSYLATCRHYRAVLDTPRIQSDEEERRAVSRCVVLYLILAPHDNEQSDMTHRVLADKALDEVPLYRQLLRQFVTPELIKWAGLCELYEAELRSTEVFKAGPLAETRWRDLQSRVVEHNIRVMARYYTRIRTSRMAQLLDLSAAETETFLSGLVVSQSVQARTDRPAGVVHFARAKDSSSVLNDWSGNLSQLMQLVNKTTHLINKEECVHKTLTQAPAPSSATTAP